MPVDTHCPIVVLLLGLTLFVLGAFGRASVVTLYGADRRTNRVLSVVYMAGGLILMGVSRL